MGRDLRDEKGGERREEEGGTREEGAEVRNEGNEGQMRDIYVIITSSVVDYAQHECHYTIMICSP